jgi:hypothetical protein
MTCKLTAETADAAERASGSEASGGARRARALALVALAWGGAGCDARATSTDPQAAPPRAEQKSREYESCSATVHCADELRCFEQSCRRTVRSAVGDYYAALGAAQRGRGKLVEAVAAYAEALARYEADKVPVPPELDCAYGGALAASNGKKEQAELAARVLHRCLTAVPVGGALYGQALADLTRLADVGFEPATLAKAAAADVYLTKAPAKKSADSVVITATANPAPSGKTFALVLEEVAKPALRGPLLACWEAHLAATQKEELAVTFGVKAKYVSEYEDEPGYVSMTFEPGAAAAGSPAAAAEECVRAALEPIKKTPGLKDSATTKLTVTLK